MIQATTTARTSTPGHTETPDTSNAAGVKLLKTLRNKRRGDRCPAGTWYCKPDTASSMRRVKMARNHHKHHHNHKQHRSWVRKHNFRLTRYRTQEMLGTLCFGAARENSQMSVTWPRKTQIVLPICYGPKCKLELIRIYVVQYFAVSFARRICYMIFYHFTEFYVKLIKINSSQKWLFIS